MTRFTKLWKALGGLLMAMIGAVFPAFLSAHATMWILGYKYVDLNFIAGNITHVQVTNADYVWAFKVVMAGSWIGITVLLLLFLRKQLVNISTYIALAIFNFVT